MSLTGKPGFYIQFTSDRGGGWGVGVGVGGWVGGPGGGGCLPFLAVFWLLVAVSKKIQKKIFGRNADSANQFFFYGTVSRIYY